MCLFIFQVLLIILFAKNNYAIDSPFLPFYLFTVLLFCPFTILPFQRPYELITDQCTWYISMVFLFT